MSDSLRPPHLADVIMDELEARGWYEEDAAARMDGDYWINLLALEMFLSVRRRDVVLAKQGEDFAKAFGVQRVFFDVLHERWVSWAYEQDAAYQEFRQVREAELRAKE